MILTIDKKKKNKKIKIKKNGSFALTNRSIIPFFTV